MAGSHATEPTTMKRDYTHTHTHTQYSNPQSGCRRTFRLLPTDVRLGLSAPTAFSLGQDKFYRIVPRLGRDRMNGLALTAVAAPVICNSRVTAVTPFSSLWNSSVWLCVSFDTTPCQWSGHRTVHPSKVNQYTKSCLFDILGSFAICQLSVYWGQAP